MKNEISELVERLRVLSIEYEQAKAAEESARSSATSALNNLNIVQKELSAAWAKMKAQAPRDSNWNRDKDIPVKWVEEDAR